jgi:Phosphodiester glycosidase
MICNASFRSGWAAVLTLATAPSPPAWAEAPTAEKLTVIRPKIQRGTTQIECVCLKFRDTDFDLLVIDNGPRRSDVLFRNLPDALNRTQCIAGTNGGFFDVPSFRPNGLMIAESRSTGEFDPKNWASGVLAVRAGKLTLADQSQFITDTFVTQLLQTGPWLVRAGKKQSGFADDRPARRTFIATDGAGTWILGHLDRSTLLELTILLTSPSMQKVLPIREALNLDGGSSSALWATENGKPTYIMEKALPLRSYIGLKPRGHTPTTPR